VGEEVDGLGNLVLLFGNEGQDKDVLDGQMVTRRESGQFGLNFEKLSAVCSADSSSRRSFSLRKRE